MKTGAKAIELRLFDSKRRKIALGDTIRFQLEPQRTEFFEATVAGLLHYPTFESLLYDVNVQQFGSQSKEEVLQEIHHFYSLDEQTSDGVLGIKILL